ARFRSGVAEGNEAVSLLDGHRRGRVHTLLRRFGAAVVVARVDYERSRSHEREHGQRHEHDGQPARPPPPRRCGIVRFVNGARCGGATWCACLVLAIIHTAHGSRLQPCAPCSWPKRCMTIQQMTSKLGKTESVLGKRWKG